MKLDQVFFITPENSNRGEIKCKFVRGPVPLPWLLKASAVDSMALSVAWVIWFYCGLNKSQIFKLSNKDLINLGINRQTKSRVLKRLEEAELIKISRCQGKSPIIEVVYNWEQS